jgi:hypothetical protein
LSKAPIPTRPALFHLSSSAAVCDPPSAITSLQSPRADREQFVERGYIVKRGLLSE